MGCAPSKRAEVDDSAGGDGKTLPRSHASTAAGSTISGEAADIDHVALAMSAGGESQKALCGRSSFRTSAHGSPERYSTALRSSKPGRRSKGSEPADANMRSSRFVVTPSGDAGEAEGGTRLAEFIGMSIDETVERLVEGGGESAELAKAGCQQLLLIWREELDELAPSQLQPAVRVLVSMMGEHALDQMVAEQGCAALRLLCLAGRDAADEDGCATAREGADGQDATDEEPSSSTAQAQGKTDRSVATTASPNSSSGNAAGGGRDGHANTPAVLSRMCVDLGAMQAIVTTLVDPEFKASASLAHEACRALTAMVRPGDGGAAEHQARQTAAIDAGALAAVCNLMSELPWNAAVQQQGASCIHALLDVAEEDANDAAALDDSRGRKFIALELNVVQVLRGTLASHSGASAVQVAALRALSGLLRRGTISDAMIAVAEALPEVIGAMSRHPSDLAIQIYGSRLLHGLCEASAQGTATLYAQKNSEAAAKAGALTPLLEATRAHEASPKLLATALHALLALTKGSDVQSASRKQHAAEVGAIARLLALLEHRSAGHEVVASAAACLGAIVGGTNARALSRKQAAVQAGGIGTLLTLLQGSGVYDLDVARECCRAIGAFCSVGSKRGGATERVSTMERAGGEGYLGSAMGADPFNGRASLMAREERNIKELAVEAGAIDATLRAMGSHHEDGEMQEIGCLTLVQLSSGTDESGLRRKQQTAEAGAISSAVIALRLHGDEPRWYDAICLALTTICTGSDAEGLGRKQRAVDQGALEVLLRPMHEQPGELRTQERGCGLLRNLCMGQDAAGLARKDRAATAGAIELIEIAIDRYPAVRALQDAGNGALRNILGGKPTEPPHAAAPAHPAQQQQQQQQQQSPQQQPPPQPAAAGSNGGGIFGSLFGGGSSAQPTDGVSAEKLLSVRSDKQTPRPAPLPVPLSQRDSSGAHQPDLTARARVARMGASPAASSRLAPTPEGSHRPKEGEQVSEMATLLDALSGGRMRGTSPTRSTSPTRVSSPSLLGPTPEDTSQAEQDETAAAPISAPAAAPAPAEPEATSSEDIVSSLPSLAATAKAADSARAKSFFGALPPPGSARRPSTVPESGRASHAGSPQLLAMPPVGASNARSGGKNKPEGVALPLGKLSSAPPARHNAEAAPSTLHEAVVGLLTSRLETPTGGPAAHRATGTGTGAGAGGRRSGCRPNQPSSGQPTLGEMGSTMDTLSADSLFAALDGLGLDADSSPATAAMMGALLTDRAHREHAPPRSYGGQTLGSARPPERGSAMGVAASRGDEGEDYEDIPDVATALAGLADDDSTDDEIGEAPPSGKTVAAQAALAPPASPSGGSPAAASSPFGRRLSSLLGRSASNRTPPKGAEAAGEATDAAESSESPPLMSGRNGNDRLRRGSTEPLSSPLKAGAWANGAGTMPPSPLRSGSSPLALARLPGDRAGGMSSRRASSRGPMLSTARADARRGSLESARANARGSLESARANARVGLESARSHSRGQLDPSRADSMRRGSLESARADSRRGSSRGAPAAGSLPSQRRGSAFRGSPVANARGGALTRSPSASKKALRMSVSGETVGAVADFTSVRQKI